MISNYTQNELPTTPALSTPQAHPQPPKIAGDLPGPSSPEQPPAQTQTPSNPSPISKPREEMTAADWELRYLESEERRIRERKEALLRSQSP
ncbi:hypothetical protein BDV96DRAFT_591346 [Lophiotrema nucula]|uniref:Uncharacterized protein n=1 Tax=Lophiotrema nucula TaxID=690887 RepID=A0A6A5YJA0_9PLEO|nr:hypothetical protein BDV96DRAFT_591346 [Lophiotrema nucula]